MVLGSRYGAGGVGMVLGCGYGAGEWVWCWGVYPGMVLGSGYGDGSGYGVTRNALCECARVNRGEKKRQRDREKQLKSAVWGLRKSRLFRRHHS